ncbi:sensor histidine kinase [Desulfoferrobacter suflitae]|uniref:sensor histidine kinase n=1 Tax=Desulfoferrobacter suflitae TaxID=2865782 RepID=UPI0021644EC7|nr:hybrid sensor histidine kinase/response regulator [Desulfoferrobacter suflitae]MCK8600943.1 hybrid sensor histidine kinase/response regulator [Desulfoferrobacter suflitae]
MKDTILLVDDEEGIRKVLSISLADSGYDVLTASNGEEALGIFRTRRPPLVLTDIKMPGMDGVELLRKIKQESPDTEVIMITGHGDMGLAIRSLQFDAADFVTKPINDEALEIALRRARERIWMRDKLREYTENLERLVTEKTRQLVESERLAAIGQTVAVLAHAIKNITGGLKGGMFVLEKGIERDDKQYLSQGWEMIKGNVDKIANLALDMLNYAKERIPDYRLWDPNRPVREVCELMRPRAEKCGVELEMDIDPDLPEIEFDLEGVHCCLTNLVTNAIDACVDVECSKQVKKVVVKSLQQDDGAVIYRVEDSGCGMDEATREKIFRMFVSSKGTKGTGLGLMITRKIVEEHGGTITCESQKGRGATFTIKLPPRGKSAAVSRARQCA